MTYLLCYSTLEIVRVLLLLFLTDAKLYCNCLESVLHILPVTLQRRQSRIRANS